MKKLWQQFEKLIGIYRWHPKIALRYLPIVEKIKKLLPETASVVEVGSGSIGIAPYLKRQVIGIDIEFSPQFYGGLIPVKASVLAIPFADKSFAAVVSVDMLEHIPPADRSRAISELMRIADKFLCIGVPCGKLSAEQDQKLAKLFMEKRTSTDRFLHEQIEYGLPEADEVKKSLLETAQKLGRYITLGVEGNLCLSTRECLMRGWISQDPLINFVHRKLFLFLIPYLRGRNQEPTYRKLFYVNFHD